MINMINWIDVALTSVSMSVDAMTVGAADGLKERNMPVWKVIVLAFIFGFFQFLMPVIGYFIGYSFQEQLEPVIPWVAFTLLTLLGVKSFIDWIRDYRKIKREGSACQVIHGYKLKVGEMLTHGVACSIDALCIGFVYLNLSAGNALIVFSIIGVTTFALSFLTTFFSNKLCGKLEKWASLVAAIIFVAIGLKILLEGIL